MRILVSACLLGIECKYNGEDNYTKELVSYLKEHEIVLCCPEVEGGLTTPRIPCECRGNKVFNKEGKDCTKYFEKGARRVVDKAMQENCSVAILKDSSPSCGSTMIYDGRFQGRKIKGKGRTTMLLEENGIQVYSENNYKELT